MIQDPETIAGPRGHKRGGLAMGRLPGGQPSVLRAKLRINTNCPKCDAVAGQCCRRWVGARVRGCDVGGGYWRPMKSFHTERRAA